MTVLVPVASELDSTNNRLALDEIQLAGHETRIIQLEQDSVLAKARLSTLETDVATLKAALVAPVVIPPILPPYDPQIFWKAGMETGNLSEWSNPNNNTGSALSSATLAALETILPHNGLWVMKQAVTANGAATRMMATSVVPQVQAGTPFWVTWYDYYPQQIKFGSADQYMFLQIAGFDGTNYNPVWSFYVNGVDFTPVVIWSPNNMAPASGPHAGESGKHIYNTTTPIPVATWAKFELYVKPASDFTGALKLYMNNSLLFDQSNIKTRYPGTGAAGQAGWMYLEHNAYGVPGVHYVDDVTYSLGRMP